jgi:hypothetical protein
MKEITGVTLWDRGFGVPALQKKTGCMNLTKTRVSPRPRIRAEELRLAEATEG